MKPTASAGENANAASDATDEAASQGRDPQALSKAADLLAAYGGASGAGETKRQSPKANAGQQDESAANRETDDDESGSDADSQDGGEDSGGSDVRAGVDKALLKAARGQGLTDEAIDAQLRVDKKTALIAYRGYLKAQQKLSRDSQQRSRDRASAGEEGETEVESGEPPAPSRRSRFLPDVDKLAKGLAEDIGDPDLGSKIAKRIDEALAPLAEFAEESDKRAVVEEFAGIAEEAYRAAPGGEDLYGKGKSTSHHLTAEQKLARKATAKQAFIIFRGHESSGDPIDWTEAFERAHKITAFGTSANDADATASEIRSRQQGRSIPPKSSRMSGRPAGKVSLESGREVTTDSLEQARSMLGAYLGRS